MIIEGTEARCTTPSSKEDKVTKPVCQVCGAEVSETFEVHMQITGWAGGSHEPMGREEDIDIKNVCSQCWRYGKMTTIASSERK